MIDGVRPRPVADVGFGAFGAFGSFGGVVLGLRFRGFAVSVTGSMTGSVTTTSRTGSVVAETGGWAGSTGCCGASGGDGLHQSRRRLHIDGGRGGGVV